jgi:hypothetical protein
MAILNIKTHCLFYAIILLPFEKGSLMNIENNIDCSIVIVFFKEHFEAIVVDENT